jgi:hypothetical protein
MITPTGEQPALIVSPECQTDPLGAAAPAGDGESGTIQRRDARGKGAALSRDVAA